MSTAPRIAVIGAGIVGASIAWHLARRGAAVTVLDRGQPAGEATEKSFAWINATWGNPEPYFRLRFLSMQEWRRLEHELDGALGVVWRGCLIWDLADHDLEEFATRHAAWGYDVRLVGRAEIAALEPGLVAPPARAAYAAGDATIEPVAATRALLAAASVCRRRDSPRYRGDGSARGRRRAGRDRRGQDRRGLLCARRRGRNGGALRPHGLRAADARRRPASWCTAVPSRPCCAT